MAQTNQIDGRTLRNSAISHEPLTFGPDLALPAPNQPIWAMRYVDIIIMSHVCNHGTDQSDRRMNVARFCDLTCTLELWTGTCFASTESDDSSHVRLQISAPGLIFAISHGWKFLPFFELKIFLFEFYFFELSLFESSIGSMMINTISPGSRGSLAASRPATASLRPAALGLPWRAEI